MRRIDAERLLLLLLAAATVVLRAIAFYHYRFDSDEPQHLHVTWGWSTGLLQYRDFFDNHAPLFHILTAPILKLLGERPDVLLWMRGPMLLLYAIVVWTTYVLGKRLYTKRVAVWSALVLALFPIYFLKSLEFRTDNLWTAFWCLALLVLTGERVTGVRLFVAGLLLGCAMATSLKTLLLLLTLAVAAMVTHKIRGRALLHALRRVGIALAGAVVVPAIVAGYFYAKGALSNLVYCAITFNELASTDKTQAQLWLQRIAYLPALAVILWIAWKKRPAAEDAQARWRFFLAFSTAFFGATLACFWVLISPRDMLPFFPILMIFLVAAIDRLDIRLPLYAGTCFLFAVGIWYYADHLEMRTDEHITMMNQVLGLTRPGEPILDLKGETIYRQRPYYYIFEFITRRAMLRGLVPDTIAQDVVRTQCHVVQADGPFFPAGGRAFLRANFLDVGRLRASGQWINDDGSFTIAVPGQYVILNSAGEAGGALDGLAYRGKRVLAPGAHSFVTASDPQQPLAVFWAPAFERGYSPFHLRDREFTNSPVYRASRNRFGSPSGRRRHRRWRPDPAPLGSSR